MRTRRSAFIAAVLLGLLAGVAYAFAEFAAECAAPTSEECFWAKHYFPLSLALGVLIVGGPIVGLIYAGLLYRRRRNSKDVDAS